jgi:hypothetical protein
MLPLCDLLFKEVTEGPTSGVLKDFEVVSRESDGMSFLLSTLRRTTSGTGYEFISFTLVPKTAILRVERTLQLPGSTLEAATHAAWLLEESFDKLWGIFERHPGSDGLAVDVNWLMCQGAI